MPCTIKACSTAALLTICLHAIASAQHVNISRDRLLRVAPDSALRRGVTVLGASRTVNTAQVPNAGLQLQKGTFAVVKTRAPVRAVRGPLDTRAPASDHEDSFYALPYQLLTPDATGTGVWELRPIFKVAQRMRWDPDSQAFHGAVFITMEDTARKSESRPLPRPVFFQLSADADQVTPDTFALVHTNFPLTRIAVAKRSAADSVRVHIAGEFDVEGIDMWLPVEPALIVEAVPPRIQGWGVGSTRILVRVVGARGNVPSAVTLSAAAGELDDVTVALGAALSGNTRLRSSGSGRVAVTASAPGFNDATAAVEFVWPVMFLLAAVLGGMLGGVIRAVRDQRAQGAKFWAMAVALGAAIGLVAAIAWYALGINLLQVSLDKPRMNELAVFGVALLAGFGLARVPAPPEGAKEPETPAPAGRS